MSFAITYIVGMVLTYVLLIAVDAAPAGVNDFKHFARAIVWPLVVAAVIFLLVMAAITGFARGIGEAFRGDK